MRAPEQAPERVPRLVKVPRRDEGDLREGALQG